jgi:hypothetical protein
MSAQRFIWSAACGLALSTAAAQEPATTPENEAIHNELREMKKALVDAVLKQDFAAQLNYASPEVVVTWQNGEVVRGSEALRAFLDKNQASAQRVFQGYKEPPEPAELTILYGDDTGISYGTSVGRYSVLGMELELTNHWTATLVRQDGRWVVAAYHVSNDILDNPLIDAAKQSLFGVGALALAIGAVVGWFGRAITSRNPAPRPEPKS